MTPPGGTARLEVVLASRDAELRRRFAEGLADLLVTGPGGARVACRSSAVEVLAPGAQPVADVVAVDLDGAGPEAVSSVPSGASLLLLALPTTAAAALEALASRTEGAALVVPRPDSADAAARVVGAAARALLLERGAEDLAAERRRLFEVAHVMSHELKSPLSAVESYLKLMLDAACGEDVRAYERMVRRSLLRLDAMRGLVFALVDLARIEAGAKERPRDEVDLWAVVEAVVARHEVEAAERGVTVSAQGAPGCVVRGGRSELELLVGHLLSNAVKFNRDGGRVALTLEACGLDARLAVADTGSGVPPERAAKLFGEFVRSRGEGTRDLPGCGLGLATVHRLVALYGGAVGLSETPGGGATFTLTLPRRVG